MRENLQQMFNFTTGSNGEVVTYFDGRFTQSQLIVCIICLVAFIFIISFVKKFAKLLCLVALVLIGLVYFGVTSPSQISDVATKMQETGISYYEKVSKASENIQLTDNAVHIKVNDKWINVQNIQGVIAGSEDVTTVIIDGESYAITDKNVIEVLKTLTN